MLLKGLSFIKELEVLSDVPYGTKCTGDCKVCLIRMVKDSLEAERDVAEWSYKKGVLTKKEYYSVQREFVECWCQLCYDFGCGCCDASCEYERFGAGDN